MVSPPPSEDIWAFIMTTPSSDKSGFATYQSIKAALILPYKTKRGYHQNCNKPRKTRTATNLQTRKQSLPATCDPGFLGTTTNFPSGQPSHTHLCKCCRWWYLGTPAQGMGRGQQCLTTLQPCWGICCFECFDPLLHQGRISNNQITLGQLPLNG